MCSKSNCKDSPLEGLSDFPVPLFFLDHDKFPISSVDIECPGAGIIYVSASDLGWQPIKDAWMLRRPEINASRQAQGWVLKVGVFRSERDTSYLIGMSLGLKYVFGAQMY